MAGISIVLASGSRELSTAIGTCVSPSCNSSGCSAALGATALCVAGMVSKDASYESSVGIGMNLNQDIDPDAGMGTIAAPASITISIASVGPEAGNAAIRVQLTDGDANTWCVEPSAWTSGVPIPIATFNSTCWERSTGTALAAGTPLERLSLAIPSDDDEDRPFSFCVSDITVGL